MSVAVVFFTAPNLGGTAEAVMGPARKREVIALDATTTATALDNEWVALTSTETAVCCAAVGTTPNAAATTATALTTAGFDVPVGLTIMVKVNPGDKIQVKAFA